MTNGMNPKPNTNPSGTPTPSTSAENKETGPKIFENIKFDFTFIQPTPLNKKPEYKSSDPTRQRKIIVLKKDSKIIPERDKTYKVKVVEDTDPSNPTAGKLVVEIYFDDAEKESMAKETLQKINSAFSENKFEEVFLGLNFLQELFPVEDPLA